MIGVGVRRVGSAGDRVDAGGEGRDLLRLRLERPRHPRQSQRLLRRRRLRLQRLPRLPGLLHQFQKPPLLPLPVPPHLLVELLVVRADALLLGADAAVALRPLGATRRFPALLRLDLLFEPQKPPHALLDRLRARRVRFGEPLERLRAVVGAAQVRPVRLLEVSLESLDGGFERKLEHVVLLPVAILDLLARRLEIRAQLREARLVGVLHRPPELVRVLLLRLVAREDPPLFLGELLLQQSRLPAELILHVSHPSAVQGDELIHLKRVLLRRGPVLRLRLVQVRREGLDLRVLAVESTLVRGLVDGDGPLELLRLRRAHHLEPFGVDFLLVDRVERHLRRVFLAEHRAALGERSRGLQLHLVGQDKRGRGRRF